MKLSDDAKLLECRDDWTLFELVYQGLSSVASLNEYVRAFSGKNGLIRAN